MRIVMPLFDFDNESSEEFVFSGGKYALRKFNAEDEIPEVPGLSELDIEYIKQESWALVAEDPDLKKYREEINILLLAFRIFKMARVFIKYRSCKEDDSYCTRLNDYLHIVMPNKSNGIITLNDLNVINKGFSKLLQMKPISDRTRNAIYFMYRGFCAGKMIDSFLFLMCAIEALFSKENPGGATKTICSRVSKFLGNKSGYEYNDINELYVLRSNITHGRVVVGDEIKGKLNTLYKLQDVLVECMKKILDKEIYLIYSDVQNNERYFNDLK